jgi:hypothetical protein
VVEVEGRDDVVVVEIRDEVVKIGMVVEVFEVEVAKDERSMVRNRPINYQIGDKSGVVGG